MEWWVIPVIGLYFVIGNYLANLVENDDDGTKLTVFICWPLVAALFIATFIVMCVVIVVLWVISIIKYLLGGFDDGVV